MKVTPPERPLNTTRRGEMNVSLGAQKPLRCDLQGKPVIFWCASTLCEMRLFYGGRASKDPPLTSIFLLVFVFVCHGVSGDETTTTVAESTSRVDSTTTAPIECDDIKKHFSIDTIIRECEAHEFVNYPNVEWYLLSTASKEDLDKFLKEKRYMKPGIHIENRPDMDSLNIKELNFLGDGGRGGLHIVNTNIQTIEYLNKTKPAKTILKISGTVTIRGNKHLKQKTIDNLNLLTAGKGADIQSFGECVISTKPSSEEFKDCLSVYGDLEVEEFDFTKDAPNFQPTAISGCLKIGEKSKVAENMFKELINNAGKNKGNNNCNGTGYMRACLKKEAYDKVGNAFQNGLEAYPKDVSKCDFTCSMEDLEKFGQEGCKTINGNVEITQTTSKNVKKLLAHVKEVQGNVVISGTDLMKIDVFKNLETIKGDSNGPALKIVNNVKLIDILFPNIVTISGPADSCVEVKENGNYEMDNNINTILRAAAKDCKITGNNAKPDDRKFEATTTVVTPKTVDNSTSSLNSRNRKITAEEKESGLTTTEKSVIVSVVVAVVVVCFAIAIIVAAFIVVRRIRKKEKHKEKIVKEKIAKIEAEVKQVKQLKPFYEEHDGFELKFDDTQREVTTRVFTLASSVLGTAPIRLRQAVRTGSIILVDQSRAPNGRPTRYEEDTLHGQLGKLRTDPEKFKEYERIARIISDYKSKYQSFFDQTLYAFLGRPSYQPTIYTVESSLPKEQKDCFFQLIEKEARYVDPDAKKGAKPKYILSAVASLAPSKEGVESAAASKGEAVESASKGETVKTASKGEPAEAEEAKETVAPVKTVTLCYFGSVGFERLADNSSYEIRCSLKEFDGQLDKYKRPHPDAKMIRYYDVYLLVTKEENGKPVQVKERAFEIELHDCTKATETKFLANSAAYRKYDKYAHMVDWAKGEGVLFVTNDVEYKLFIRLLYYAMVFIFNFEPSVVFGENEGTHLAIVQRAIEETVEVKDNMSSIIRFEPPDVVQAYSVQILAYLAPYIVRIQNQAEAYKFPLREFKEVDKRVVQKEVKKDEAEDKKAGKVEEKKDAKEQKKEDKPEDKKDEKADKKEEPKKEEKAGDNKSPVADGKDKAAEKKDPKPAERKTAGGDESAKKSGQSSDQKAPSQQTAAKKSDQKSDQKSEQKNSEQKKSEQKKSEQKKSEQKKSEQKNSEQKKSEQKQDQKSGQKEEKKSEKKDEAKSDQKPAAQPNGADEEGFVVPRSLVLSAYDPQAELKKKFRDDCAPAKITHQLTTQYFHYAKDVDTAVCRALKVNKPVDWSKENQQNSHLLGTTEQQQETVTVAFNKEEISSLRWPSTLAQEDRPDLAKELNWQKKKKE